MSENKSEVTGERVEEREVARDPGTVPGGRSYAPLVVLLLVVAVVAAITVPNLTNAIQRGRQKRTMSELRSLGTAVESYQVDHGYLPQIFGDALSVEVLRPHFVPTYCRELTPRDAWGRPYVWSTMDGVSYTLASRGKDGRPETRLPPAGATTNFNRDIYFSNGQFSIYPEGTMEG
jgi:type II secretory pathway pseudopilin PulG